MNPVSGSVSPSSAAGSGAVGLGAGAVELAFGFAAVRARPGQKAPILSALPIFRAAAAATAGSGRSAPLKLKLGSGLLGGDARWGEELGIFRYLGEPAAARLRSKGAKISTCTTRVELAVLYTSKSHPRSPPQTTPKV